MGSPTKFFGTVRQKVLTENRDISTLPPSYPYLFSRPEIFRSTDQKGFSTKFFGTVRQNFRHKIVTKLSEAYNLSKPEINDTLMGSPTKFFGTVRQKVLTENRDISPPPLILIFFRDQKFSEAQIRKVSLRNFSALWDKIFDTKSWHNSLKPKIFR